MGQEPISWTDIYHWKELTGTKINRLELKTMKNLSSVYLSELQAAKDPIRPAPNYNTKDGREAVSNRINSIFKNMPTVKGKK